MQNSKCECFVPNEFSELDLEPFLDPLKRFVEEKKLDGSWDDWNEYEHAKQQLLNQKEPFYAYHIINEDNGIIAVAFFVQNNAFPENSLQLTAFHVLKQHRGIGMEWLKGKILPELKEKGIEEIYVRSSHPKAFSFYDRLGNVVGGYESDSDSGIYHRTGKIWKVEI